MDMADSMDLDRVVMQMTLNRCCRVHSVAASLFSAALLFVAGCDSQAPPQAARAAVVENRTIAKNPPPRVPSPSETADPKSFTTSGPLVAEQQADISAEREGRIVSIMARIGDRVQKGQVLALLDDRVLRSACESQKARIASAQAQIREWEAEQRMAEADLRRANSMRAEKIISEESWEHAKYRVDETIAEVARHRNDAETAEADLKTADLQLEQSRIVAPFAGVVGRSSVRLSQEVKKDDVLFWITAEAPLQVLFTVPETAMAAFTVGKPLQLTTAAYPGLLQTGRIARVSPVVDPASGSIQVVGSIAHPASALKPGMSMQVRLAP
jgi:RND family efflux transporter MFP subunit